MAAYIIFERVKTTNEAELAAYSSMVGPSLEGHEAIKLAAGGKVDVLEGAANEAVVILKFPSTEEAEAWYRSPLYQEASSRRLKAGEWRVMIVEGT